MQCLSAPWHQRIRSHAVKWRHVRFVLPPPRLRECLAFMHPTQNTTIISTPFFLGGSPLLLRFDAFHRGRNTHRMTRQSPSARKRHLSLILFYSPLLHSRNPCSCRGEPALLLNLCGEDPSPPSLNNSHRSAHVDRQPSSIPHPLVPSRSSALPLVSFLGTFFGRRSAFLGTLHDQIH
jgi:hypothetical protein